MDLCRTDICPALRVCEDRGDTALRSRHLKRERRDRRQRREEKPEAVAQDLCDPDGGDRRLLRSDPS